MSLYWRLLISYVLVIAVASVTFWLAGQSFTPFFLDRHVTGMVKTMHNVTPDIMMLDMTSDLEAGYHQALSQSFLWALLVAVGTAGAVALYVTRRIMIPLKDLRRAAVRIAAGNYNNRLNTKIPGEIADVVTSFNVMAETLAESETQRVDLIANVAHEFRTPLSNLYGYVEGLEDGVFLRDSATFQACFRQLDRLGHLVDDLSLLSRVESGQEQFNLETVSAKALIDQTVMAFKPVFEKKGVLLQSPNNVHDFGLIADPKRTSQVLGNLVTNALRHTQPGGSVSLSVEANSSHMLLFSVTDTGEGIAKEDIRHLFTRFYRADKARSRDEGGGSGIGLTIAKHYVEQQGGNIGVESCVGSGSRFWFTLPRSRVTPP